MWKNGKVPLSIEEQKNQMRLGISSGQEIKNSKLIKCINIRFGRKRIRDARYTRQKNIAQVFILERYFFVSICPAASHGTCLAVFLAAVLPLC